MLNLGSPDTSSDPPEVDTSTIVFTPLLQENIVRENVAGKFLERIACRPLLSYYGSHTILFIDYRNDIVMPWELGMFTKNSIKPNEHLYIPRMFTSMTYLGKFQLYDDKCNGFIAFSHSKIPDLKIGVSNLLLSSLMISSDEP